MDVTSQNFKRKIKIEEVLSMSEAPKMLDHTIPIMQLNSMFLLVYL